MFINYEFHFWTLKRALQNIYYEKGPWVRQN